MSLVTRACLVIAAGLVALLPIAAPVAAAPLRCHGHVATIVGPVGGGQVTGTDHADVIVLRRGDTAVARGGDDLICGHGATYIAGGPGDDRIYGGGRGYLTLHGGPGDDRIRSSAPDTRIVGGPGDDTIVNVEGHLSLVAEPGRDSVTNLASATVYLGLRGSPVPVNVDLGGRHPSIRDRGRVDLDLGPAREVVVYGTPYDDVIRGSDRRDQIRGFGGSDLIVGRGGDDLLGGGNGTDADTVRGGPGDDGIRVTGPSTAEGGPGDDRIGIVGDTGHVDGGPGDDVVSVGGLVPGVGPSVDVGTGHNALGFRLVPPTTSSGAWTQVSVDMASGRLDADASTSSFGGTLTGMYAFDRVPARPAGAWDVSGTDGTDYIQVVSSGASPGPVTARGLAGDDTLVTGGGDDTLDGGPGTDTADAGLGTDTCVSIEVPLFGTSTRCETSTP